MDAIEAIKNRRSARVFNSRPLARETILQLLDCGRLAPTARNIQPWEFIFVTKKDTLMQLAALARQNAGFLAESAGCIAVFCKDTKYYLEDGCAATMNILLAAAAAGVSGCWVAGDKKDYAARVGELLGVPDGCKLVSLIALGYADIAPQAPLKRPLGEMVHWERYGNPE